MFCDELPQLHHHLSAPIQLLILFAFLSAILFELFWKLHFEPHLGLTKFNLNNVIPTVGRMKIAQTMHRAFCHG